MRILVIGGTYFLGKAFVNIASEEHEITVLNRGTRKVCFRHPEHVKERLMDRHSLTAGILGEEEYDLAVDFCAYAAGDIRQVADALKGRVRQYIFISTSDVYVRGTGQTIDESSPFETRDFGGEAGSYILGKIALENELQKCAADYRIAYTSIRPVFLYGPDNYAPREGIFFHWIDQAGQVILPEDSTGCFQMVYVEDAAKAILNVCGNAEFYNSAVNLCGPKPETYESFCRALEYAVGKKFQRLEVTREQIESRQIPLPFPLTRDESENYKSIHEEKLNLEYISLKLGLRKTYEKQKEEEIFQIIDSYFDENRPKEAKEFMLEELQKAKRTENWEVELKLLNELIGYYRQTSEEEPLLRTIDDALSLLDRRGLQGTVSHATTALNAANAFRSLGRLEESRSLYKITSDIYEKKTREGSMNPHDMLLAGLYNNISLLYQEMSDYASAKQYLLSALEIAEKNQAGFETAVTYANLANTSVLAKQFEEAAEYADTAIRLFQARGLRDPHYCAALSARGSCYYENGNLRRALSLYTQALRIVEETFGRNKQYERLKENCEMCEKGLGDAPKNGMELAKRYYEAYGVRMIREKFSDYEGKIAVGLAGEGSDCFGYDDDLSADHDFGPDFCMWLSDETYERIGEELQRAYGELPREFCGYTRTVTSAGEGRRGVIRISDFYKKFLGTDRYEEINFAQVEDYSLAACVNGQVFRDDEGSFSGMRNRLLEGFPEPVRLLKIAQDAAEFSQCGQYNYTRMLQRGDTLTAGMMLSDCLKAAMKLCHHLRNTYPPHDKWLYRSVSCLNGSREEMLLLDQISSKSLSGEKSGEILSAIERLGQLFAMKLYESGVISDVDPYLEHHTEELVFKAGIAGCSDAELVEKIVRLEFEAFDKVKNEGGRASCQNNWPTFSIMRKSQYLTWNREMLVQYLYDFDREYRRGHNLITEKYGRMMESTSPERYEEIKDNFPELSEEKKAVIEQIVQIQMGMAEELSGTHPGVIRNARLLHTYEDNPEDTSYETYLRGEISTYSDKMLQLYGKYVAKAAADGENIAHRTMENTAKLYGYRNLEEFESRK